MRRRRAQERALERLTIGRGFYSSRAGGLGVSFLPSSLPNLAAWFKFNSGITEAAGAVSQWDDQSGNGRHLKQATATNQPAVQVDGSILFDGIDNFLKCDAFTLNQPFEVYLLAKQVTWTSGDRLLDGNTVNRITVQQQALTPQLWLADGLGGVTGVVSLALDTYGVVTAVAANGGTSSIQVNNGAAGTGTLAATAMNGFTLGGRGDAGGNFGNIQVKEAVIYTEAHDAAQRAIIINYLAGIGGISL